MRIWMTSTTVHLPWDNLKCLGIRTKSGYLDYYWNKGLCKFTNDDQMRIWYRLTRHGWKVTHWEADDCAKAARLFRRRINPNRIVELKSGDVVEVISYPFVGNIGGVRVMVRMKVSDPTTLKEISVNNIKNHEIFD